MVHMARDARGWMSTFLREVFHDQWVEARKFIERGGAVTGAPAIIAGRDPSTVSRMVVFVAEKAAELCPKIAEDEIAASAQFQRPPGPGDAAGTGGAIPFVHVNADAFTSIPSLFKSRRPEYNHEAEVRIADHVRELLGLEKIAQLEGQRFETPTPATSASIGNSSDTGNIDDLVDNKGRNGDAWRWVYYWVPNYDEVITKVRCPHRRHRMS